MHPVRRNPRRGPVEYFVDGVARTAPARAAYTPDEWGAVASLSPELFLCRRGDLVTSSPIKGTLPWHAAPAALRASRKDVAENVMIVDLVRNDLGRVAAPDRSRTPNCSWCAPRPGEWHLVSTVSAQVPLELPSPALLDATFPPASVTGTPKIRARELIAQWEQSSRGVCRGTIGWRARSRNRAERRDPDGRVRRGGQRGARAGGGITADSDPDANGTNASTRPPRSSGQAPLSRSCSDCPAPRAARRDLPGCSTAS